MTVMISPKFNIDSKATEKVVLDALRGAVKPQVALFGNDKVPEAYVPIGDKQISVDVKAYVKAERQTKVDKLLTATLETSLHHLDDLRRSLERTNQKNISDVRKSAGYGADLLAAIEGTITYFDLVQLINEMRDGIALRRAAAKGVA